VEETPDAPRTIDGDKHTSTGHEQPEFYLQKCLSIPANARDVTAPVPLNNAGKNNFS
jgi:hypothetical protein